MRALMVAIVVGIALTVAACGGDNLSLCDGCPTRTPAPSLTPTPSATAPTPTVTPTP